MGTTSAHNDGDLFDGTGTPAYCQMMSMHWGVADAETPEGTEVVAEYDPIRRSPCGDTPEPAPRAL